MVDTNVKIGQLECPHVYGEKTASLLAVGVVRRCIHSRPIY